MGVFFGKPCICYVSFTAIQVYESTFWQPMPAQAAQFWRGRRKLCKIHENKHRPVQTCVCGAGDEQVLLHFLNVLSRLKISLIKVSKRILSINQFLGFFYETRSVHCDVWKVSSRERDKKKVKPNKSSPLRRISGYPAHTIGFDKAHIPVDF